MPPNDLEEIQQLVWHDVRETELPALERDSVTHLRYMFDGVTRYVRLHVLWIEVKDPKYVRVVIGISTNTVASDGWDFMVRKTSLPEGWKITGSTYWGIPSAAPTDFRIPP